MAETGSTTWCKGAAKSAHLPLKETNALILRRGPYVIAAGLDQRTRHQRQASAHPVSVTGDLINLFDADLSETRVVAVEPGTRALLLDVNYFKSSTPRILAASAKIMESTPQPAASPSRRKGSIKPTLSFASCQPRLRAR